MVAAQESGWKGFSRSGSRCALTAPFEQFDRTPLESPVAASVRLPRVFPPRDRWRKVATRSQSIPELRRVSSRFSSKSSPGYAPGSGILSGLLGNTHRHPALDRQSLRRFKASPAMAASRGLPSILVQHGCAEDFVLDILQDSSKNHLYREPWITPKEFTGWLVHFIEPVRAMCRRGVFRADLYYRIASFVCNFAAFAGTARGRAASGPSLSERLHLPIRTREQRGPAFERLFHRPARSPIAVEAHQDRVMIAHHRLRKCPQVV